MTYMKSRRELTNEEKKKFDTHESRRCEFVRLLLKRIKGLRERSNFNYVDIVRNDFWWWLRKPVIDVYLQWEHKFSLGIHVYKKEYFEEVKQLCGELEIKYGMTGEMNGHTIWMEFDA